MSLKWIGSETHNRWLGQEEDRLLSFGRNVVRPDGTAAQLDGNGRDDDTHPSSTFNTARMAHIYFLAAMRGTPGAYTTASALLAGLTGAARDTVHGGWHDHIPAAPEGMKTGYTHAHVVLAAASATAAGHPDGPGLLNEALTTIEERFWEAEYGMISDAWNRDWTALDAYRGINANMHMLEALLAAYDVTGNTLYRGRAQGICTKLIEHAAPNEWRIPEHFDSDWSPVMDYNADSPGHQFKPYGATIGHGFEWSRLLAQTALTTWGQDRSDLLHASAQLFSRAEDDGWQRDGAPGFVYTTDWDGTPVVPDRMHWVAAEAIAAAAVLYAISRQDDYCEKYSVWWDYAATYLVDVENGSWHHQLDLRNVPTDSIWPGKPDLYHTYQTALIPQLAPAASIAGAVTRQSRVIDE